MIAYKKEKTENAICFFAFHHRKKTRKPLSQTFLYKYLGLLDFKSIEDTGRPVLELAYKAMEKGPVPIEIYSKRDKYKTNLFEFKKFGQNKYVIIPKGKPDLSYFSEYEIDEMNRLVEIYASRFVTTGDISDASHEEIIAWKKTWEKSPNSIIDYRLTFDDNIEYKPESELVLAEESFLIYEKIGETSV